MPFLAFPNKFCFTFLFLFLYSVLKVPRAARSDVARQFVLIALSTRGIARCFAFGLLSVPSLSACTVFPFVQTSSRRGTGSLPVVGSNGLEPSTSRLSGARSNHLSYEPIYVAVLCHSGRPVFGSHLLTPRPPSSLSFRLLRVVARRFAVVETNRIELSTPCLQGRCSPS